MSLTIENKYSFDYTMDYLKQNQGVLPAENDSIWNSQVSAPKSKVAVNPSQTLDETPKQKEAKSALKSDLDAFKASGVNVSWDGNTCKLQHNGKTATITLDSNGEPAFAGDMEYMQNYLLQSSPKEQESTQKYDNFIKQIQDNGGELVEQNLSKIKINGKATPVIECTIKTKDGKEEKVYLDNDGNQVKPD